VTQEEAMAFVGELGCLKNFPSWNPAAVDKIADNLARLCKTPAEAQRLVNELTGGRFDEWPGPATVKGVYEELFEPQREFFPTWNPAAQPPAPDCEFCLDLGGFEQSLRGPWVQCGCSRGQTPDAVDFVAKMNAMCEQMAIVRAKAAAAGKGRIRAADFRGVMDAIR
jgi:hypothetical protein